MKKLSFSVQAGSGHRLSIDLGGKGTAAWKKAVPEGVVQARRCPDCRARDSAGPCPLLSNCLDVLVFFSDKLSSSRIEVQCSADSFETIFRDSSQRVMSLLLIYCMVHSRCHFFSRFRFVLPYYGCITSPEALIHLIVTTDLIERHVSREDDGDALSPGTITEFNDNVAARLDCIFETVKDMPGEDSLRNAFQILQSVNYITREHFEDFLRDMTDGVSAMAREAASSRGACVA